MKENAPAAADVQPVNLPAPVAERGISKEQWRTLMMSLYPGARSESVLMVWDYCRARKLDPLKKPCHIVPMQVTDAKTGEKSWRDVVMPGIYEYRATAIRTGQYLGHSQPEYGPEIEAYGVKAPEWCQITFYRFHAGTQQRIEFPVRVYFREVVALRNGLANQRWKTAPIQMLTKCCEAAGLRAAFPDEIGGEMAAEEMLERYDPSVIEGTTQPVQAAPESDTLSAQEFEDVLDEFRQMLVSGGSFDDAVAMIESRYNLDDAQREALQKQAAPAADETTQESSE